MGLVFASLLLLAGLMSVMTRLFQDRENAAITPIPAPEGGSGEDLARAAAAAVAFALAEQEQSTARPLPLPPTALVSAWQLGMRTRQMTQKGQMGRGGKD